MGSPRQGGPEESASVWPTRALRWRFPGSYCSCNLRDALCVWETVAALRAWCASVRAVRAPSLTNGTTCRRRRVIQDSGRGGWIARRTRATDGPGPIDLAFLAGHILRRCLTSGWPPCRRPCYKPSFHGSSRFGCTRRRLAPPKCLLEAQKASALPRRFRSYDFGLLFLCTGR
jgi:hypothetical protein